MKTIATLIFLVLVSAIAYSQEPSCLSQSSGITWIDTIHTSILLPPGGTNLPSSGRTGGRDAMAAKQDNRIIFEILIGRTSTGAIQYFIAPGSIHFTGGDPEVIDQTTAAALFTMMAQATVAQGVMAGYTQCTPDCQSVTVRVCQAACVRRIGNGLETRFESCDPYSCCVRTFQVCCPNGPEQPVTKLLSIDSPSCTGLDSVGGGACESTCK